MSKPCDVGTSVASGLTGEVGGYVHRQVGLIEAWEAHVDG